MTELKTGDRVWVQVEVMQVQGDIIHVVSDEQTNSTKTAIIGWVQASDCKHDSATATAPTKTQNLIERWVECLWLVSELKKKGR